MSVNVYKYICSQSAFLEDKCYDISLSPCASSIQLNKLFLAQSASNIDHCIFLERFSLHTLFFIFNENCPIIKLHYYKKNTPYLLLHFELSLWIKASCAAESSVERRHWSIYRSRWSALSPDSMPTRAHAMGDICCTRTRTHVTKCLENVSATRNVTEK